MGNNNWGAEISPGQYQWATTVSKTSSANIYLYPIIAKEEEPVTMLDWLREQVEDVCALARVA